MLRSRGQLGDLRVLGQLLWAMRRDVLLVLVLCGLSLPVGPQLARKLTPDLVVPLLGIAASVLLAFRLNLSYQRWWEARQLWGALRNACRDWQSSLLGLLPAALPGPGQQALRRQLLERQVLLAWALASELRPGPRPAGVVAALAGLRQRLGDPGGSHALQCRQAEAIAALGAEQMLDTTACCRLLDVQGSTLQAMGGLERLASTPFPAPFRVLARLLVWLFGYLLFLKLETSPQTEPLGIAVGILVMLGFVMAERLASWHDAPLLQSLTGLPLNHLCARISADLLGSDHPLAQPPQGAGALVWS